MSEFTKEQLAAIDAKGKTIVSASAGSGKTTVMIEKIIRLIQGGESVDSLLAVTFTKKAAAQMKEKLSEALVKSINEEDITEEKRERLKRQLSEVPNADISTIHSFCSKLIRSHFFAAGVDNAFRVIGGDDAEGTALKNEALDELLETGYKEKDERFMHLLSVYWRKKSDKTLRKIFLKTYEGLRDRADYIDYLKKSRYDKQTFDKICADLLAVLKEKCNYYLPYLEDELSYFEGVGCKVQIKRAQEAVDYVKTLLSAEDYFAACALGKPKFTKKYTNPKDSDEKKAHIERMAFWKSQVSRCGEELSEIRSYDEELDSFLRSGETATALAQYLLQFDEKYEEKKQARGVLDYNDLEHKALALLKDETIAKEMRDKYRYVFVDEYQDVNPVQETIISRVSGENLFLVGDVKQSIYGFRGSKSKFFVEKQREFAKGEKTNSLAMTSNFRSADAVLDAVNTQFSLAMTPSTCSVDYAKDSYMGSGGLYKEHRGRVQVHFIGDEPEPEKVERGVYSVRESAKKKDDADSLLAELKGEKKKDGADSLLAKTIQQIIYDERKSDFYDIKEKKKYKVRYSDIAVLSRKKQGEIEKTVAALSAQGIPVTSVAAVNVCDYMEVKTLIDVLSLLDNAEQDIPLCSALLSPMGDLTADELAKIRLAYKDEPFFRTACKKYTTKEDVTAHKLREFYKYFGEIRTLSRVLDAGELLTRIMTDKRMEANLLSRANGVACLKRIHRFIEEASNPEPLSVHAFLDRLRDLDYEIKYSENGGEDSVKVMTMHSSKGLEYPVVILDNLSAPFRSGDRDEVFVEEEYGLAPRAFDVDKMMKSSTLLRRLHEQKEKENSIADELNLYYVALTRAKYSLHMIFKERSVVSNVKYAGSFAELTDFSVWKKYVVKDSVFTAEKPPRDALMVSPDEELTKGIVEAFRWEYPYAGYENLPVKSSATALLADKEEEKTPRIEDVFAPKKPTLVEAAEWEEGETETDEDAKTNIEKGLAYHAFLERFDFSALYDENGNAVGDDARARAIASAYEKMQLDNVKDWELLDLSQLDKILSNRVFYTLQGMQLYKERQFLVSLPIRETYAKYSAEYAALREKTDGEEMIFQGAIDLLAVGKEVRIIDYKYSRGGAEYLKKHYAPQLDLYRLAVAKIMRIPAESIRCSIVNIYHGFQVDMD